MSQADVKLIQAQFERFAETGQLDSGVFDPEFEWHSNDDVPLSGVHRGPEVFAAIIQDWSDSFDDLRVELGDFIDRGEYVVVSVVIRGRIRGTKGEVNRAETWVWKVREGMVVEGRGFKTLEQALHTMGLEG